MSTADTSHTKRIARIRQHIAGREYDGGNAKSSFTGSSGHFSQKRLGRTIFYNQLASGAIVADAVNSSEDCVCAPIVAP